MGLNDQRELDRKLGEIAESGAAPSLLLHACCGPCGSYVLEYLSEYFKITVLYYNPNIYPQAEYALRLETLRRLISALKTKNPVLLKEGRYEHGRFLERAAGLEKEPEGGARCLECFSLRLEEAAAEAARGGFDWFTTTLSVSPHKDAQALNRIGGKLAEKYGVRYLRADFKKRGGYGRSIELSRAYGLYRQNYCGCEFSPAGPPGAGEAKSSPAGG